MNDDISLQASGEAAAVLPAPARWQARVVVAMVALLALLALFWPRSETNTAPPGMLTDSGGQPVTLASRMAPVTLVHFWATWCPPCLTEVPSLQRLVEDQAGNHRFSLVMIAVDDDPEKVKTFLDDRFGETLFDQGWKVSHSYGTRKLPETHMVVGGEIVHSFIGATDWDAPENRRLIEQALARAADA